MSARDGEPFEAERLALLDNFGATYGTLGIALTFTITNDPARGDVKRGPFGWTRTAPLPSAERGAALMRHYGTHRNPALVARASGLIVVETDTPERLAQLEALAPSATVTVQSSAPFKRHHWYRPWSETMPAFAAIRMEAAAITVDTDRLFLVPPSRHPSGSTYAFVHSPEDTEIAVLTQRIYDQLVRRAGKDETDLRRRMSTEPGFKVPEGRRRESVFRFASMCRRWTADEDVVLQLSVTWAEAMCEPKLTRGQVAAQVHGAMRTPEGGQEIERLRAGLARATGGGR